MGLLYKALKRASSAFTSLLLITAQLSPMAAVFMSRSLPAAAAQVCTNDQQGANDEPGQKDLTKMCADTATSGSGYITVIWDWDEVAWSGNNSGDGCALFNTDGDSNANYSLCAVVKGNPAAIVDTRVYSCTDGRADRCTGSVLDPTITSTCTVAIAATQPFGPGAGSPNDTVATCTIQLSDVGGAISATLLDVCSYPSQQPNSDPSDCIKASTSNTTTIEVVKQIVPEADSGKFNLYVEKDNGTVLGSLSDAQDGYTTGTITINASDDVVVKETAGSGSSLSNYTTTITCVDQNGATVPLSSSTVTGATRKAEIDDNKIGAGDNIVCTFTNTRQNGSLTVVKNLIKDNGATQTCPDFSFQVDGGAATPFEVGCSNTISYPAGTAVGSITEPAVSGFTTTYSNCANLTIVAGQTQTCTITNNDVSPQLTVIKHVINDNGGGQEAEDFTIDVTGTDVSTPSFSGAESPGVTVTLDAGSYSVAEGSHSGYEVSYSDDCDGIINIGLTKTCTVTNNDIAPVLTLIKIVTNNDGGTNQTVDWLLSAAGPTNLSGQGGATSGSDFKAGTYALSESGPSGYTASVWTCTNGVTVNENGQITLSVGQSTECTVTNDDDAPTLTLRKAVVNNNGGSAEADDWTLTAQAGDSAPAIDTAGIGDPIASTGAVNVMAATTYTLSESGGPSGYAGSEWVCTSDGGVFSHPNDFTNEVRMALGANVTCTITNDDVPAEVTLIKKVVNDNGGEATQDMWTLSASGADDSMSGPDTTADEATGLDGQLDAGVYTLSESEGPDGYQASDWSCTGTGGILLENQLTVELGADLTCTITNDDIAPKLTLIKNIFDETESATEDDFTPTLNGAETTWGDQGDLQTGEYTVGEESSEGWQLNGVSCYVTGSPATGVSHPVELELADDITCEVTNEKLGEIVVTKFHDIDEDGEWDEGEPTLSGWEMSLQGGETTAVETTGENGQAAFGNLYGYYMLSETQQDGWRWTNTYCTYGEREFGGLDGDNMYYLSQIGSGRSVSCFVGNAREPYMVLAKTNDSPDPVDHGDEVTYTLTLTVPEDSGKVYGQDNCEVILYLVDDIESQESEEGPCHKPVTIIDIPPMNITYVPGSWTAVSNVRGDLKAAGIVTEPAYGSPGEWFLTNELSSALVPGEVITLTYRALVGDAAGLGVHPDRAFAYGYDVTGATRLLANETVADTPFVGTEVSLVDEPVAPNFVLGTSTTVQLVNTGQSIIARTLIGSALIVLVIALSRRSKQAGKTLVAVLAISSGLWLFSGAASAESSVTLQAPQSPTNDATFTVDYIVSSTEADNEFSATLYINDVASGSQSVTEDYGDSGTFDVSLPSDGTYTLKVAVTATSGTEAGSDWASEERTVVLDRGNPAAPSYGGKTVSGGKTTVTFTVPSGSDATTVDIYASTNRTFALSDTTKVGSVVATPGVQQQFTFTNPTDGTYYVAVVTRDGNGNASTPVGDSEVTIVTNTAATPTAAGAGAQTAGATTGTGVDIDGDGTPDGEVAGESTGNEEGITAETAAAADEASDAQSSNLPWLVLAAVVVAGIGYYLYRARTDADHTVAPAPARTSARTRKPAAKKKK